VRARVRISTLLLVTAGLFPVDGEAQRTGRTLAGHVTGADSKPVAGAEVRLRASDVVIAVARTDSAGRYAFVAIVAPAPHTIHVRRLGFRPATASVPDGAVVLDVRLDMMPAELDEVLVSARVQASRGRLMQFYANRERAQFGRFFDSEALEKVNPRLMSDLMRHVPGVRLIPGRLGSIVRIRGCRPLLWIDGQRLPGAELDEFVNMRDVAAVEVYNSFAGIPPQYVDRQSNCGAVIVWTKL
jgi:hypothetical protein